MAGELDLIELSPRTGTLQSSLTNIQQQTQQNSSRKQSSITVSEKKTVGGSIPFGTIDTSFKTIYNDMIRFRKVYRNENRYNSVGDDMLWATDQPGHFYFKLFFYFSNPYADPSDPMASNLLGTSYSKEDASENHESTNTALNYLYNNCEYTRFSQLAEFIQLLSDVSTKCPWYFQQISGLSDAVERQETGRDFKIEEERKSITVKCLPDAYDNRIGRLLDLYRSVVWSNSLKKWIVPRNLRKFDMGIYIFNSPVRTVSGGRYGVGRTALSRSDIETTFGEYYGNSAQDSEGQGYTVPQNLVGPDSPLNSKYIELRGCEIDYNSIKSGYDTADNAEGSNIEYSITIKYDTAYEDRYDPLFNQHIGDFILEDIFPKDGTMDMLRTETPYGYSTGVTEKGTIGDPFAVSVTGYAGEAITDLVNSNLYPVDQILSRVAIGNLYGFSFAKLDRLIGSDPLGAFRQVSTGKNNASLLYERYTDFSDPEKDLRQLQGKNMYNGWVKNSSGGTPAPSNLQGPVPETGQVTPAPSNIQGPAPETGQGTPAPDNIYG